MKVALNTITLTSTRQSMHVQVSYDWFNLSKFIKSNLSLHIIYKTCCFPSCIISSEWHAILFHFPCFIVQLPSVVRNYLCLLATNEMWFYLISFHNRRPAWMEDVWKFKYAINVNECMFGLIVPKNFNIIWFSNFPTLRVPDDDDSRNISCALNLISTFFFIYMYNSL